MVVAVDASIEVLNVGGEGQLQLEERGSKSGNDGRLGRTSLQPHDLISNRRRMGFCFLIGESSTWGAFFLVGVGICRMLNGWPWLQKKRPSFAR